MILQAGLGGSSAGTLDYMGLRMGIGGEKGGRRGGLGVWFQTKNEGSVKGEETDFVITAPFINPMVPPPDGSLRSNISRLVYSTTTDTLQDITEEQKSFPIRYGLVKKHGRIRMLTTYRDAHIYLFPHWVLEMVSKNETMDSISEDVVGWWAKAGWQTGLSDKMGFRQVFENTDDVDGEPSGNHQSELVEEIIDIGSLSTTHTSDLKITSREEVRVPFASRVSANPSSSAIKKDTTTDVKVPAMLAYIHSSKADAALIRRVDTTALLLSVSLKLAKLDSIEDAGRQAASPFAHAHKVAFQAGVAQRCTVTKADCLLAENVTVEEKSVIKESVIGTNCHIKSGARLTRCVLMDGVVVGERCQLTSCILGRRCQIGKESVLKECEVQEGNVVADETDAKGENFMVFEGLEEENGDYADNDVDENGFESNGSDRWDNTNIM